LPRARRCVHPFVVVVPLVVVAVVSEVYFDEHFAGLGIEEASVARLDGAERVLTALDAEAWGGGA